MKKLSKGIKIWIWLGFIILVSWLFDFPSWFQENAHSVLLIMIAVIFGGFWWLSDELKEIKKILYKILNKE